MEKMNQAFTKVKILVGMEVDEPQQALTEEDTYFVGSYMDDFNRQCTLSTKQVGLINIPRCPFICLETQLFRKSWKGRSLRYIMNFGF